jgi:dipeptidyl aminopeptidase/acylaminoacyl peptidase
MTDEQLERRLRDWYRTEVPADLATPADLRSGLAAIPQSSPETLRRFTRRRGLTLLAAAVLLTSAIVGGALLAGSDDDDAPAVVVASDAPTIDAPPGPSSPPVSVPPASPRLIAYVKFSPLFAGSPECPRGARRIFGQTPKGCSRIWVSNSDGTGAHELVPDHPGYQTPLEWSPDGTRLLFEDAAGLWLVDASGTIVQSIPLEDLCPIGCVTIWGYEFSPDGTKIAFERTPNTTSGESVIAVAELVTGHVTEITSTASEGNDAPHWSPDGTRLTFARQPGGHTPSTLFMVNVDGSDLHRFLPPELYAIEPRWSPDGSLIAFLSEDPNLDASSNIYAVGPDGIGLRRLTSDGVSARPEWTADGRIVYARAVGDPSALKGYELWIMDADGANQAKLAVEDVVQLTAAHCVACAWVRDPDSQTPLTEFMINALWQPTP